MKITNIQEKILSKYWKQLKLFTYQYHSSKGEVYQQKREVYDKGDGAAVLLYNPYTQKVLLTQQFRMPAYMNGVEDGLVVEVPAGMLDQDDPEKCILKEIYEETGYQVRNVTPVFDCFMTPGAVTEITYFFIAEYNDSMKVNAGGGLKEEQEDLLVFEIDYAQIKKMIRNNEVKDAKTLILFQYAYLHNII